MPILYEHHDFRGQHKHIDHDEPNLHQDAWGDRASSIQISAGQWEFYQHTNYAGHSVVLGPGSYRWVEDIGIDNDSLSSVKFVGPAASLGYFLTIFEHSSYGGAHTHLVDMDLSDLRESGWSDRVSSFYIDGGRWAFYRHIDYNGESVVLGPGKYPWVVDAGIPNDTISSIKRHSSATAAPGFSKVILYEHINFGGEHKHLVQSEADLHTYGWGNRVSSVQVYAMGWWFYDQTNYTGSGKLLVGGHYHWVEEVGIPNDSISSAQPLEG